MINGPTNVAESSGLPIGYPHWSYGKEFIRNEQAYRRGMQGLAYEIVINSSPCIAYLMEENTMATQALVIAHACYGHNSFFKGNHLFRQWTAADAILDYLVFARRFVMQCEERHGATAVEEVLDACHALMPHGVDRPAAAAPTLKAEAARFAQREAHANASSTIFGDATGGSGLKLAADGGFGRSAGKHPLFRRKFSPKLEPWGASCSNRAKLAQYFYPQAQTKVMNEGWATFWLHDPKRTAPRALVDDGFMLEFKIARTWSCSPVSFAAYNGSTPTRGDSRYLPI